MSGAVPFVVLGGRAVESSAVVRLRAGVHPSLGHQDGPHGKGGAGRPPSLRVRARERLAAVGVTDLPKLPFVPCREVKLSVVSYLTNSIVDQILQELYATHKTLVNRKQQPLQ